MGITSQIARERLLREEDLTLDKTIEIHQVAEASERQIQSLAATVDRDAHVNYCNARRRHQQKKTSQNPMKPKSSAKQCGSCDTVHASRACLACGKAYNKCGKMGYLVRVCRSKPKKGKDHFVSHNEATSDANEMFVGLIVRGVDETKPIWNHKETTRWELFDQVQGSDVSIISERQYRKAKPTPTSEKSHAVMTSYSGTQIPNMGPHT